MKRSLLNKLSYWIPAILYMTFIFCLSSRPAAEIVKCLPIILGLKIVHMIEYGMLFYLIRFATIRTTSFKGWGIFLFSLALTILYSLSDEFHQMFVPSRSASLVDVLANGVGAALVQCGINLRTKLRT